MAMVFPRIVFQGGLPPSPSGVRKSMPYLAFHRIFGKLPLCYFRKRQLMQVRSTSVDATTKRDAVKRVALGVGPTELGRPSVEYHCLSGESPSVSLSKSAADQSEPRAASCPALDPTGHIPLFPHQSSNLLVAMPRLSESGDQRVRSETMKQDTQHDCTDRGYGQGTAAG